jgi:hypothetical protein
MRAPRRCEVQPIPEQMDDRRPGHPAPEWMKVLRRVQRFGQSGK